MTQSTIKDRKFPIRSKQSDEELALLINQAKKNHPEQFSNTVQGYNDGITKFRKMSSVSEVISKWL